MSLCDSMNGNIPGLPVLHHLPELAQTHVHCISDAVQPSRPLLPTSPPVLSLFHQGLFQWVGSSQSGGQSIGASVSASVLPMNIQGLFPLGVTTLISLLSKELLSLLQRHSSKASIFQRSTFFVVHLSHPYMTAGKTITLTICTSVAKWYLCFLISCLCLSWLYFQGVRVF